MNEYERVAIMFDDAFIAAVELVLSKARTYKDAQREMYKLQRVILQNNSTYEFVVGLEKKLQQLVAERALNQEINRG